MDVDQSLDALIKAAPKTTKKTAAGTAKKKAVKKNGKVKAAALAKKKPAPAKKKIAIKTGRNSIRKSAIGGRSKAMMGGGRAVGMAIDQVVRGTGGRRATTARVTPNKATNDAPTKLLVSNLDFNVTEKDIKVCSNWTPRRQTTTRGEETIQNNFEEKKEEGRRTLLLLLCTARRRTTLSIFCAREREDFSKKKPFVVS